MSIEYREKSMKKALEYFVTFIFIVVLAIIIAGHNMNLYDFVKEKEEIIVEQQKEEILATNTNEGITVDDKLVKDLVNNVVKNRIALNETENRDNFNSAVDMIKEIYVEEINDKKLYEDALTGILSALDPHSVYLNKKDFEETQTQIKGEFGGLGIVVTRDSNFIKVVSPIDNTPASRAGVLAGDYIGKIGEESTYNMSLQDAVSKMRGKIGEKVKITILRKNAMEPIVLDLRREAIKMESIKGEIKNKNIIYIRVSNFIQNTKSDLVKTFNKLGEQLKTDKQVLAGVILDLRNNPGGLLDQAIKVSELFLEKDKTVVSIKGKNGILLESFKSSLDKQLINKEVPVVVIVNEGSASASEIVAGALQDYKRALIIGQTTFGKASVQKIVPLKSGDAIKITMARYYTPNDRALQADGIKPDIEVKNGEVLFKQNEFELREKDLKGHLVGENEDIVTKTIKENIENEKKEKDAEMDTIKDYQLLRAIDLIQGIEFFGRQTILVKGIKDSKTNVDTTNNNNKKNNNTVKNNNSSTKNNGKK